MQRLFFEMECSCDPRGVANPDKKWMNSERGERARGISVYCRAATCVNVFRDASSSGAMWNNVFSS